MYGTVSAVFFRVKSPVVYIRVPRGPGREKRIQAQQRMDYQDMINTGRGIETMQVKGALGADEAMGCSDCFPSA